MFGSRVRVAAFLFSISAAFLIGCSGGGQGKGATVEGKVTVGGVAANSGEVLFNVGGQSISGPISSDGTYRAVGVGIGDAKVTVISTASSVAPPKDPRLNPAGKDMPGMPGGGGPPVPIPAKYSKAETSDLSFTVKSGANTYNIDLTK